MENMDDPFVQFHDDSFNSKELKTSINAMILEDVPGSATTITESECKLIVYYCFFLLRNKFISTKLFMTHHNMLVATNWWWKYWKHADIIPQPTPAKTDRKRRRSGAEQETRGAFVLYKSQGWTHLGLAVHALIFRTFLFLLCQDRS
jgi:hypothetical protein